MSAKELRRSTNQDGNPLTQRRRRAAKIAGQFYWRESLTIGKSTALVLPQNARPMPNHSSELA